MLIRVTGNSVNKKKKIIMNNIDAFGIPVIVDDVKQYEKFLMTRLAYFSIQEEESIFGILEELNTPFHLPVLIYDLSAVILGPIEGSSIIFENAGMIDHTFSTIENGRYFININEIWLPNSCFGNTMPKRSDVYRISGNHFKYAHTYNKGMLQEEKYSNLINQLESSVKFSEIETKAFNEWNLESIEKFKLDAKENPQNRLEKRKNE